MRAPCWAGRAAPPQVGPAQAILVPLPPSPRPVSSPGGSVPQRRLPRSLQALRGGLAVRVGPRHGAGGTRRGLPSLPCSSRSPRRQGPSSGGAGPAMRGDSGLVSSNTPGQTSSLHGPCRIVRTAGREKCTSLPRDSLTGAAGFPQMNFFQRAQKTLQPSTLYMCICR